LFAGETGLVVFLCRLDTRGTRFDLT